MCNFMSKVNSTFRPLHATRGITRLKLESVTHRGRRVSVKKGSVVGDSPMIPPTSNSVDSQSDCSLLKLGSDN